MVKYYCFYCDVFLSHGSPGVRKSHNNGWKHKTKVREYYTRIIEDMKRNDPHEASVLLSYNTQGTTAIPSLLPGMQQHPPVGLPQKQQLNPLLLAQLSRGRNNNNTAYEHYNITFLYRYLPYNYQ